MRDLIDRARMAHDADPDRTKKTVIIGGLLLITIVAIGWSIIALAGGDPSSRNVTRKDPRYQAADAIREILMTDERFMHITVEVSPHEDGTVQVIGEVMRRADVQRLNDKIAAADFTVPIDILVEAPPEG